MARMANLQLLALHSHWMDGQNSARHSHLCSKSDPTMNIIAFA